MDVGPLRKKHVEFPDDAQAQMPFVLPIKGLQNCPFGLGSSKEVGCYRFRFKSAWLFSANPTRHFLEAIMGLADWFSTFCGNLQIQDDGTISSRYKAITRRLNTDFWSTTSDTAHSF